MIAPRWRKATRDVLERPGRSLLAVLAMAAGAFALSTMAFKYAILHPVLNTMYGATHPASAVLITDRADDALVAAARAVPGVVEAEARPVLLTRVRVGDEEWIPALVHVVRDFDGQRLDRFEREQGAWPPGPGEVLLERSAVAVARTKPGASLAIRTAGGGDHALRVAGTVHAPGLAPAWMEHVVYGFVGWGSALRGEDTNEAGQIRIRVDHPLEEGYIREVADRVAARLSADGVEVRRIDVPTPGRHPHADQMDTFTYLLGAFGILSFVLSAVLVASMVHALLSEQLREVGIMKALGASSGQIAGVYLAEVGMLSAAALAIGVPLGLVAGRAYARFSAQILNADVTGSPFPWWAAAALVVVGIVVPLLVALVPLWRAARVPVREALGDALPLAGYGSHPLERALAGIRWLPRHLVLSLRTIVLRRGRLALTVGNLALGGAVFMAALNVAGSWNRSVIDSFAARHWDLTVVLAEPQPIEAIASVLRGARSVSGAEYWPGSSPYLIGANGVPGKTVSLLGLPPGSRLLDLPLASGRWLAPGDVDGVVVNNTVVARNPSLVTGGRVEVRLDGRTLAFPIVGVARELTPAPVIYAPAEAVLRATGQSGDLARTVRVVTRGHTAADQLAAARELERAFAARGMEVAALQRMLDVRQSILDHIVILLTALTLAALLVVVVGALALTSTLTIDVVQRTREIGILGAIGATPRTIAAHVWVEAVLIGIASWMVANLLALPVSWVLEDVTGRMFFRMPLDFYVSPIATLAWLGLVLVLASASSAYPAWRAARLTVREAIAHA